MRTIFTGAGGRHRSAALSLVAGALILVGTACDAAVTAAGAPASTAATGPPRVVEWGARDYAYTAPERLPSGWVTIRMTNHGDEPHHGQLLRLNDGVSLFVDARNLADKRYVSNVTAITDAQLPGVSTAAFYPGEGRSVFGGVSWAF